MRSQTPQICLNNTGIRKPHEAQASCTSNKGQQFLHTVLPCIELYRVKPCAILFPMYAMVARLGARGWSYFWAAHYSSTQISPGYARLRAGPNMLEHSAWKPGYRNNAGRKPLCENNNLKDTNSDKSIQIQRLCCLMHSSANP